MQSDLVKFALAKSQGFGSQNLKLDKETAPFAKSPSNDYYEVALIFTGGQWMKVDESGLFM